MTGTKQTGQPTLSTHAPGDVSVQPPAWSMRPDRWQDPKPPKERLRVLLEFIDARDAARPIDTQAKGV